MLERAKFQLRSARRDESVKRAALREAALNFEGRFSLSKKSALV